MKICFKCRRELPLSEFYRNVRMADGHLNKCRKCCAAYTRAHYRENRAHFQERNRIRAKLPHRRKARRDWRKKDLRENPEKSAARLRRYRKNHPERQRAHNAVARAIKSGRLKRGPCEMCGATKDVVAHHDDYEKLLEVRWFCRQHHMAHHYD